jgi:flagellar biosynthetic protein FlhB
MLSMMCELGIALAPLFGAVFVVAFLANVAQVGLMVSLQPLAPNFTKLDPISGTARMFSARSAVELGKAVAKVSLVGYVVYSCLRAELPSIMQLVGADYRQICAAIGGLAWKLLVRTTAVILVIAAFDYAYQRIQHEKSLRMTKQEVKEDFKRSEGDPMIKSRIRQRQRERRKKRRGGNIARGSALRRRMRNRQPS